MNKFTEIMTDEPETTDESHRDDSGLAGMAVGVDRVTGAETPGIVRGSEDITVDDETVATRVLVELEDGALVDTDAGRVEVI